MSNEPTTATEPAALDQLRAEAVQAEAAPAALSAPGSPASTQPEPAPTLTAKQEAAATIAVLVTIGESLKPGIRTIYTDAAQDQLAEALGAVAQKYGFTVPEWLDKWRPEINLAIVAFPLVRATAQLFKPEDTAPAVPGDVARAPAP